MKKILHIEIQNKIGGIEKFLCNISSNGIAQKYILDFITTEKPGVYIKELQYRKIIRIHPACTIWRYAIDLYNVIRNGNYDIIHIHKNSLSNFIPVIIAYFFCNKVIIHSHNTMPKYNFYLLKLIHYFNRILQGKMNIIRLSCSQKAGEWMYGNKKKFLIIRNGVNYDKYTFSNVNRKSIRQKYQIEENEILLGSVAMFMKQKNHKYIIDILEYICARGEKVKLFLIGTGPLKNDIENYVKKKEMESHVIMLGERNDVFKYLSAIDVLVMPSLYEGLPISAIEAQITGCNVLISDNVDTDVCISKKLRFLSLKDGIDKWGKNIIDCKNEFNNRQIDISNEYDISETITKLQSVYNA